MTKCLLQNIINIIIDKKERQYKYWEKMISKIDEQYFYLVAYQHKLYNPQ